MKKRPLLQIALDNLDLPSAIKAARAVDGVVDIMEIGTILLCSEGLKAVKTFRLLYPDKIILADAKIADAGAIMGDMLYKNGADIITAICCADINTIKKMQTAAAKLDREVQIELTGEWTWKQAEAWQEARVGQVVYHRSRDAELAGKPWSEEDHVKIKRLIDMGFKVTVTGGINLDNLHFFADLDVYIVIAGRALRDADDPMAAGQKFIKTMEEIWAK